MVEIFVLVVMVAYYIDYKNDKKIYGKKGQSTLYLVMIAGIAFIALKRIFF